MLRFIACAWLPVAVPACAAGTPRVALLYSDYGDFRHRDDYDARLAGMGWSLAKFENARFADLVGRVPEFDILLGTALFNYSNVQDFSADREALLAFLRAGGAIVLTDCNYPSHVQWLTGMGEGWEVSVATTTANPTPMGWLDADHPLFTAPNRINDLGGTWAQMQTGDAWTVLARSDEGGVTAAIRREGRGFIYITSRWPLAEPFLENLWTCLQLSRGGLEGSLPDLSGLTLGRNRFEGRVRNLLAEPRTVVLEVRDQPENGEALIVRDELQLEPGASGTARVSLGVGTRGTHTLSARLLSGGREVLALGPTAVTIPPLLQVPLVQPWYRGSVYAAAPPQKVVLEASVTPDPGDDLAGFELRTRLASRERWASSPVKGLRTALTVPLEEPLGDRFGVVVALYRDGERVAGETIAIPVVPPRPHQVFLDERGVTRVDGRPFFPIGIYHVGLEDLAGLPELGFNAVVAWGTTPDRAQEGLDAAQVAGLKVVLELSAFLRGEYDPGGLAAVIERVRDHPALLTWYTVDEPSGKQLEWCQAALAIIARGEPDHPAYLVSCSPGEFAQYATTTEVFAIDPYPIPHASVAMVADWMKAAQEAVGGSQPIWLIPQCHNSAAYGGDATQGRGPTPAEERCMVYQGLIYGAKGIIYYPWDDGPCGLVHDEALTAEVARINAELGRIGVELLLSERRLLADSPPHLPGLRAASFVGKDHVHVIATNTGNEALNASLPFPGAIDDEVEVLFEGRGARTHGGMLRDHFEPLAVHVYRLPTPR